MDPLMTETMLMPKYVSRFACIGGECEDTCCASWRVPVDEATLRKYEACEDPVLKPLIQKHIKRNPVAKSGPETGWDAAAWGAAHIEMLEGSCHECPFLDGARRCLIQQNMGEEALSDGCHAFPRSIVDCGDFHQMALRLSCPEAARLALLAPDAFEMEVSEASIRPGMVERIQPQPELMPGTMEEIRTWVYDVLQAPTLDLSRRLAVLGIFCLRLTELIEQKQCANLSGLIKSMEAMMENGAMQISLKPLKDRQLFQAKVAWTHLAGFRDPDAPLRQRRVLDAAALGLGIPADGSPDEPALKQALEVGTARLEVALQAAPQLLEHYLFNEAFRQVFPWSERTPYRHFINLLLGFTLLKVMLVGRSASQDTPLTPDELVETVQVFYKKTQHGAKAVDWLAPDFDLGDWKSLGTLLLVV